MNRRTPEYIKYFTIKLIDVADCNNKLKIYGRWNKEITDFYFNETIIKDPTNVFAHKLYLEIIISDNKYISTPIYLKLKKWMETVNDFIIIIKFKDIIRKGSWLELKELYNQVNSDINSMNETEFYTAYNFTKEDHEICVCHAILRNAVSIQ